MTTFMEPKYNNWNMCMAEWIVVKKYPWWALYVIIDWLVIVSDVYYDVKPSAEECESVACNCAPSSGCNEDCINRLVFSECSPQLCPCGWILFHEKEYVTCY